MLIKVYTCTNLVKIFSRKECLVFQFVEVGGEGLCLGAFLPLKAGAVPIEGVVSHLVIVRVSTCQNTAPAGAAQWRDCELRRRRK